MQSLSDILSSARSRFVCPSSSLLASCLPAALLFAGENVYCAEVERVVASHPSVALGAVYGVPDPSGQFGELVKAVVQLRPGCTLDKRALVAHCAESLARYKLPALVDFVASIPLTGSGKVAEALPRQADARGIRLAAPVRTALIGSLIL